MLSFDYTPRAEEEIQKMRNQEKKFELLVKGLYPLEVVNQKLGVSKSGNTVIYLQLKHESNGKKYMVFDNLVATENMLWKTKHFCDSGGLQKEYEAKLFNNVLCDGRVVWAQVDIQEAGNDKNGKWWDAKNIVTDYVIAPSSNNVAQMKPLTTPTPNQVADDSFNDDIPF